MNWLDGERIDTIKAQCVNPTNYGHVCWLTITDASITEAYESDTRIQGTVTALDAKQYVPLSMIRLIHEAKFSNGENYRRVLGTFFAMRSSDKWKSGAQVTEFELKSVLYGMLNDLAPRDMTIAKNSLTQAAYNSICSTCNRQRLWLPDANNKRFDKNRVLEAGDSYLSWLHQLADMSGNRVDCDENGRVTFGKYIAPSKRSASMKLAYNSPLVLASGIVRTSNEMEIASRSIVTWEHSYETKVKNGKNTTTKTERKTITEYADVAAGHPAHIGRRGFRVSVFHNMDDLGDSKSTAQTKAKSFLSEDSASITYWEIETRWFEVHEGDILNWKPADSEGWRKVLVHNIDKDLWNFTMKLKLKEV